MTARRSRDLSVRLAIRSEGAAVNAYLADPGTMEGARLLGSLNRGLAERPALFAAWKRLMTEAMAVLAEEAFGCRPEMTERAAPPHERGGSA